MKEISILLVGIGGYGAHNGREVMDHAQENGARIVGIVDPYWKSSALAEQIEKDNIPVFDTLDQFYSENTADLAVISTPIYMHADMSIYCMEHGSDVMCEKPVAATLQEAARMQEASERTGRNLTIGYQLSHTRANLALKEDILAGVFGKPLSMYSALWWPRNSAYYQRPWAAKKRMNGQYVLDSIAMNACAHYLHNMLFLLGGAIDQAAKPESMKAVLLRGNDIEMYDTAFICVRAAGIDAKFIATHISEKTKGPVMRFEFEKGVVTLSTERDDGLAVIAEFTDGTVRNYGATAPDNGRKIWNAVSLARGEGKNICTCKTALSHLIAIDAASEYIGVKTLDKAEKAGDFVVMPGLDEVIEEAFAKNVMPWEITDEYGQPVFVDLTDYDSFGGLFDEK